LWYRTIASHLLRSLAADRRRVVSAWRLHLYMLRLSRSQHEPEPTNRNVDEVVRHMLSSGQIVTVRGVSSVYIIDTPYAEILPTVDEHIIMEANPWAVLSHATAMRYHDLTDLMAQSIVVSDYGVRSTSRLPVGTMPEDWIEIDQPRPLFPKQLNKTTVTWRKLGPESDFGTMLGLSQSLPIYITDLERTLLDGLRSPRHCGGIAKVFDAWRSASPRMSIDRIIEYTERLESPLMRQRVGFVLETLRFKHVNLVEWQKRVERGGSMRLVAEREYASTFAENWGLSINVDQSTLNRLREES